MKFVRSTRDYLKNNIDIYYNKDGKIVKESHKYNKLMPYLEGEKKREKVKSKNYYTTNYEYLNEKNEDNNLLKNYKNYEYEEVYDTESDLYKELYKKKFNYEITFDIF